jgi:hypothetical protein
MGQSGNIRRVIYKPVEETRMGTAESNPLVEVYSDRIGQPSTADEAFGYWV